MTAQPGGAPPRVLATKLYIPPARANAIARARLTDTVCAAVERKDFTLMQASVMMIIFFFTLANLLADVVYARLNPRIRLE